MMFDNFLRRKGRLQGQRGQNPNFEYSNIIGVNYADSIYTMEANQSPNAWNTDFGNPIGSISKVEGFELLLDSLGSSAIKGLHTWPHSAGDKMLVAWDKYLYLMSGETDSFSKGSQADWETWTLDGIDPDASPGDIKMVNGTLSEIDTLTADFDGTHSGTTATGDKVQLTSATVPAEAADIDFYGDGTYYTGGFLNSSTTAGQTFTVGANTRAISKIVVVSDSLGYAGAGYGDAGTVTMKVYSDADKSEELGSADAYVSADGDHTFTFDPPILDIEGGHQYYFELTTEDAVVAVRYFGDGTDYAGGCCYYNGAPQHSGLSLNFKVYKLDTAIGTYTHGILDPSAELEDVSVYLSFNTTTPAGTRVLLQTRVSLDSGGTWSDWTSRSTGYCLIPAGVNKAGYRVQWRACLLTYTSGNNPSLNDVSVLSSYIDAGTGLSPIYDLVNTPDTALLNYTRTVPAGTSAIIYAAGSSDGVIFGDWQEISNSGDSLPPQRYLKFKVVMTNISAADTPVISDYVVSYSQPITVANQMDISPLGRVSNLLTGNRVRFCNYQDWLLMADGGAPFMAYYTDDTQDTGTAQAGTADSLTLAADASAVDDFYNNAFIAITDGPGNGQVRWIQDYVGSTKAFTPSENWLGIPGHTLATFTRASVANKEDGTEVASGVPRYESARFGNGLLMEESTDNLVKTNAGATADFSDATGWSAMGTGQSIADGVATLQSPDGSTVAGYGCALTNLAQDTPHSYLIRARYKDGTGAAGGLVLDLQGSGYDNYEQELNILSSQLTTEFRNFTKVNFDSGAVPATVVLRIFTSSTRPIEVEFVQLEQKSYATTFINGTRVAEALTIPTAGVFAKGAWAIEFNGYFAHATQTTAHSLWECIIDANNYYQIVIGANGDAYLRVCSGGTVYQIALGTMIAGTHTITVLGNGSVLRAYKKGVQMGTDVAYVEPVGTLPATMAFSYGLTWDDLLFATSRTLAEHQAYYSGTSPHAYDEYTNAIFRFDSTVDNEAASTYSIGSALKVRNLGVPVPASTPSGVASATTGNPNGDYTLKYTHVNADGIEGNPSAASASVTTASKQITWTIPVDSSSYNTTAKRRLYRTAAGGTLYKYIGEIADNTTTTFTDNVSDVGLGDLMLDNNNAPPAYCTLIYEFGTYVFFADLYDLWYSKAGNPDQVPNISGDIQMMPFPDEIQAIKHHPYALMVTGKRFLSVITASDSGFIFDSDISVDTTTMKTIDSTSGGLSFEATALCVSPDMRTTVFIATDNGIRSIVPGLQDASMETIPLSKNIEPFYEKTLNRDQAAGVFFNNYYLYSTEYQDTGAAESERLTFAYDLRTNQWYGPWEFGMSCYTIYDNALYAGDAEAGKVYRMFTGSSFAGTAINMICDLPMRAPASEAGTCKFLSVMAIVDAISDTASTYFKPKVDEREATITVGSLATTFTGDTRPGHDFIRTKKHKIALPAGHTYSLRIADNSVNPLRIEKIITEYKVLALNK